MTDQPRPEQLPEGHAVMADPPGSAPIPDVVRMDLPVHAAPLVLGPTQALEITAPTAESETAVIVHTRAGDAWRAVLLPPGSRWVLAPRQEPPAASLWLPPGTGKKSS